MSMGCDSSVKVQKHSPLLILEKRGYLTNSIVVVINKTIEETIEINNKCRQNNSKMVYIMCSGLSGSLFVDALDEHIVMDTTGEIRESIQIKDIKYVNNMITIHCDMNYNLNIGDMVQFKYLQGTSINVLYDYEWYVVETNSNNFKIQSKCNFVFPLDFEFINGTIEYIMVPTTFNHNSLINMLSYTDNITNNINAILSNNYKDVMNEFILTKDIYFEPVTSIMCGIASTEIIKLISHKYIPTSQWFTWSDHSIFPKEVYITTESVLSYYKMLKVKLTEQNILMVGCGALGCEWLKILSQIGCGQKGTIDVVDMDNIEHSNLSRQYLFRPYHVGMMKCKVAIDMIKENNSTIQLNPYPFMLSR